MIWEIFKAAIHSVGTATTMTAAGVYLHRRGMITTETKTGMARYTQQIAIPALFFTKIVDCPQNFSEDQCPNILDHLGDAWVLLIWPFYVLGVGLLVGKLIIYLVQPPEWQHSCVLAATAFANAMGMPITLLDVIGHNFQPPAGMHMNRTLDPSMFQSIYVILNPVLQWGLGGWLLSNDNTSNTDGGAPKEQSHTGDYEAEYLVPICEETPACNTTSKNNDVHASPKPLFRGRRIMSITSLEDAGYSSEGSSVPVSSFEQTSSDDSVEEEGSNNYGSITCHVDLGGKRLSLLPPQSPATVATSRSVDTDDEMLNKNSRSGVDKSTIDNSNSPDNNLWKVLKKIASKAMQPPVIGAMAGFVVASYSPLRGLFVDLTHRADNAPMEWVFDGVLTLANSAIPVNMCVVGVNLSIASQRSGNKKDISTNGPNLNVDPKTVAAVVLGKMLVMPIIGVATVWILKTFFWSIPEEIQFQFYLVLLMNFVTPTANVVMVIAELGSGPNSKNVMASLIGWQYVVAPVLLTLTVMMIVWTAIL